MSALEQQLNTWRSRERAALVVRGLSRCFAIAAGVLAVACLVDWFIDRFTETPFALRVLMTAGQVLLSGFLAWKFVLKVSLPSLDRFAARAETLLPQVRHRFVTALQLSRRDAAVQGMSPMLIREVVTEAEDLANQHTLPKFADRSPYKRAAWLVGPVLLVSLVGFAVRPAAVFTLVARQALLTIEIDRGLSLTNITPEVLPAGESYQVRIRIDDTIPDGETGSVYLEAQDQPSAVFPLVIQPHGTGKGDHAVAIAELPPSTVPVTIRAWLGGARLRAPATIRFEPRPTVKDIEAAVLLPRFVDPSGMRKYRRYQPQGEIFALVDSGLEVSATFSKPIVSAEFALLRRGAAGQEEELERKPMTLAADGLSATVQSLARAGATAYRIHCRDEFSFVNLYPPTRGITLTPDRPPEVRLLPEVLKDPKEDGPLDDYSVEGMPLRLGGQIQVGWYAKSPLGLARAYIVYRINDGPWTSLTLTKTTADETAMGRFVPELGLFLESGPLGQVEFYPIPAKDSEAEPDGLTAGGRFNFKTSALKKRVKSGDGWTTAELELGDTVEIRVALFDRKPVETQPPTTAPPFVGSASEDKPTITVDPRRPAGWSPESRIKTVVSDAKFQAWRQEHYRTRVKLGDLEKKQRAVFAKP